MKIKVFHGATQIVEHPRVDVGRDDLDFGKGFYVTKIEEEAQKWAERQMINRNAAGVVNVFQLDTSFEEKYRTLRLESYNNEWLNFVVSCRKAEKTWQNYDIIEGGVANDRVIEAVEDFIDGYITREKAIELLQFEKPNNQICIINQSVIDNFLSFDSYYLVEKQRTK